MVLWSTDSMSKEAEVLIDRCRGIHSGSGEAIDWVGEVRAGSKRLDRESEGLVAKLRQARILSRRLMRTAARPFSVGFFGLSQAGKSYLISALAAGAGGELETELDGERLNFIAHVNPPGHGKEATGLVTRFTRQGDATPKGYPIALTLFSEVDLVKVLGNAYFNDFDREQVQPDWAPTHIRSRISALAARHRPHPTGGIDEDDLMELAAYFERRFPKTMQPLAADYWPSVLALAAYLDPADRAALFGILWGEIPDLTVTYRMLRDALAQTGFAQTLYCPVSALVARDADGDWTQADSIMNVDILERLGRDGDDRIPVLPLSDEVGIPGEPIELPRSLLAALTAELRFVLADAPKAELLEQVDLLDFPGYRGRLAVANLAEVRKQLKDDQVDPVAQLVLRGKVAYLFERYTDDQEMNVLILCAPCHKQSDVKDLGPVLETWVHATQGAEPQARERRLPGLIWAITMFDFRLSPVPGETEDLMRKGWEGMMKLALLERFGAYNWLHEWSPGRPFDNCFLVRKPRMATAVIATRDGREIEILPEQTARLGLLKATFCDEPAVRKHVKEPATAWDAMLALNDGGISRLTDYLAKVARPEVKLARIREQVLELTEELSGHRLGVYYHAEGAAEVAAKARIAARLGESLGARAERIGDLLALLQPQKDQLRAIYLRTEDEPPEGDSAAAGGLLVDLGAVLRGAQQGPDGSLRFARATMGAWAGRLKAIPENPGLVRHLDLPKEVLEDLVDELLTAADRLGLETRLSDLTRDAEAQSAARRALLAERQVFSAATCLGRFIDYLGVAELSPNRRPVSAIDAQRPLFAPPPTIPPGERPQLAPMPIRYAEHFILDWLEALRRLVTDNAGHAAGRDISPEQNARLGQILATIRGEAAVAAGGHGA